jgi:hypothetical protein
MELLLFIFAIVAIFVALSASSRAKELEDRVRFLEQENVSAKQAYWTMQLRIEAAEQTAQAIAREQQEARRRVSIPVEAPAQPMAEVAPDVAVPAELAAPIEVAATPVVVGTLVEDMAPPTPPPVADVAANQTVEPVANEVAAAPPPLVEEPREVAPDTTSDEPTPSPTQTWEQWLGVRGAAALGAGVLVLAGVYFFRYSVQHGLIGPGLRVILGLLAGAGCISAGELWLRRKHALLAGCLSGAGIAVLYLSVWAGFALYSLFPQAVAWIAMVLITLSCCALSFVRQSAPIALMGLLGGFVTPILLSTGSDRPIALFSYLLLLDLALLFVAAKRRWPALALLSMLGTLCYQALWIGLRMGPARIGLGMLIVTVFGALFSAVAARTAHALAGSEDESAGRQWRPTLIGAALVPFAFALYFGIQSNFGLRFYQGGIYLLVLTVGAAWMARAARVAWLTIASTCAALGVFTAWCLDRDLVGTAP